ncbi:MAG: hypothetical protein HY787_05485 [Deltaproteobacteria bacterium]|nr:hypothetical protein [Deltaproteobacteria bacterium]
MNDLASLSATKLVEALKNKQMGSLELLEFYIEFNGQESNYGTYSAHGTP